MQHDETKVNENLSLLHDRFTKDKVIIYEEINSTIGDRYSIEDIVEIFIRANAGGTKLSKSDLLFSLLISSWDEAESNISALLKRLNSTGYKFDKDFILKSCLVVLKEGASYKIEKLRNDDVKKQIIENWNKISESILFVKDFLLENTFKKNSDDISSYQVFIPLIYLRYHFPELNWKNRKIDLYIIRTMLSGTFGGNPSGLIDKIVQTIDFDKDFRLQKILNTAKNEGKTTSISAKSVLSQYYNKKNKLSLIMNYWYRDSNYKPIYKDGRLDIKYIFSDEELKKEKQNSKRKYTANDINRIGNLIVIPKEGELTRMISKSNYEWFNNKLETFFDLHCIPNNKDLWQIEKYEDFIKEREKLIINKLKKTGLVHIEEREKKAT